MANINYCPECGQKNEEGVKFCPNCGKHIEQAVGETPQSDIFSATYTPGFSSRVNDPEILAATEKANKAAAKFLIFLAVIPPIGFPIYALATKDMELSKALIIGVVISAVLLLFNLISKSKSSAKNSYEAVVIDKKYETTITNGDEQPSYRTVVRTVDGRKKTIQETSHSEKSAYGYLNVGDRFRYHPQFAYRYEKYDKSKDGFVYCACCTTKNDLSSDRCQKCGVPLLK